MFNYGASNSGMFVSAYAFVFYRENFETFKLKEMVKIEIRSLKSRKLKFSAFNSATNRWE